MKKILTVELDQRGELIELHLNKPGAEYLKNLLVRLIEENQDEHLHLMTPNWGGDELSEAQQNSGENMKLMNHLKIMYWEDEFKT